MDKTKNKFIKPKEHFNKTKCYNVKVNIVNVQRFNMFNITVLFIIRLYMYNTSFLVKYNNIFTELEENINQHNNKDIEYTLTDLLCIREKLYLDEYISVFGVNNLADDAIDIELKNIYNQIIQYDKFKELLYKITQFHNLDTLFIGFLLLFHIDVFYITHQCICQYLTTYNISHSLLDNIHTKICN